MHSRGGGIENSGIELRLSELSSRYLNICVEINKKLCNRSVLLDSNPHLVFIMYYNQTFINREMIIWI